MGIHSAALSRMAMGVFVLAWTAVACAWEFEGTRTLAMHTREGQTLIIGTVEFVPEGDRYRFTLNLDHARFTDHFLSMKEFKCLESPVEIQCHVPYPYPNRGTVSADDLAWLEHSLLFLFKAPRDFGARLWNGLYYHMTLTDAGIVGTPEAIDLNLISAPPSDPSIPPYGINERGEIAPDSRWFNGLSIR
ncbi:MAG: hypothetical protein KDG53_10805 [Rhodocyclaceae bacterium]|nr:hypothetical protein [Rhodocyclaceae bacterium]